MSIEDNIRKVTPYVPGEQPVGKVIKLNTNENPYPPAREVGEAIRNMNMENLRLYPDPECMSLRKALADRFDYDPENIFVGVGSDDVLSIAFLTFFNSDKPILFPDITYSFYSVWADVYNIPYERIHVDENLHIKKEDYYRENGGIIITNPNAPTAIGESPKFIEDILKHNKDSVVIVDEAYVDFGCESVVDLIDKYKNLVVVQTFSKSRSMAGMRIGYAIADKNLIKVMSDVKFSINSYTMNQPALQAGIASVQNEEYFRDCIDKIISTREYTKERLESMGFTSTDSKTNFLFVTHKDIKAEYIFEELKKRKIYVRYFNLPRINNYLRITVGTREDMDVLIENLEDICNL